MPFQAYLDTIERETGKAPADLRACAAEKGWVADGALRPEVKAGVVIADSSNRSGSATATPWPSSRSFQGKKREGDP